MKYDPKKLWQDLGKKWIPHSCTDELCNLKNIVSNKIVNDSKILDVGSGNGRIYLYLKNNDVIKYNKYIMCDFVKSFRKSCQKNTGILPDKWDGKILPYKDDKFDFVISFSVMLHVHPEYIDNFLREHVRVSKKYIFIATWYEGGHNFVSGGSFEHNYYDLFKKHKLIICDEKIFIAPEEKQYSNKRYNWLLSKE